MEEFEKLKREHAQLRELLLPREDGNYSFKQFLIELCARRGSVYGWRDAYVAASRMDGLKPVTMDQTKRWALVDNVPSFAFDQISRMDLTPPKKGRPVSQIWSEDENDYLVALYKKNPLEPDTYFARTCYRHFRRPITINSIKGKLYRLRQNERILTRNDTIASQEGAIAA